MLFLSHANPEDNEFSRWLALQLANEGYPVWCDLTKLLGGEDFWADIEQAIRDKTKKFLYVLSRSSNRKPGPLQELQVALSVARQAGLSDFVIPILIDDLPHTGTNIQLARLNAIPFNQGWATGFRTLLEKLQKDQVAKDPRFTPNAVAAWWESQTSSECEVIQEPEEYLSNWFPIRNLPPTIYFHLVTPYDPRLLNMGRFPYPARRHGVAIVSFADAGSLSSATSSCPISASHAVSTDDFLTGRAAPSVLRSQDARNILSDLLRKSWENYVGSKGLLKYSLANRSIAAFFADGLLPNNKVAVPRAGAGPRNVVGFSTRKDRNGNVVGRTYWHFALECRPTIIPDLAFAAISHVLFSDDGRSIWTSKARLHRSRRSECKDWWNPEWRDRSIGVMKWLAGGEDYVRLNLGTDGDVEVDPNPIHFKSPVSYQEPKSKQELNETEPFEESTETEQV